jgi:hypothetical protein
MAHPILLKSTPYPKGFTCSQPTPQHEITVTLTSINRSRQLIGNVGVKQSPKEAIIRKHLKFKNIF